MPKCVHSRAPVSRVATDPVDPDRSLDVLRHAGQRAMQRRQRDLRSWRTSGTSPGVGGTIVWPSAASKDETGCRRCLSSGATGRPSPAPPACASKLTGRSRDRKAAADRFHVVHPMAGIQGRVDPLRFLEQRIEHVPGAIAVREELAARFFVNVNAEFAEKRTVSSTGNARRTRRTIVARPPQKSRSVTMRVRDIAAGAAAYQNLRARPFRAFEQHDRSRGIGSSREDRRREPGGAGADDRNLAFGRQMRQGRSLSRIRVLPLLAASEFDGRVGPRRSLFVRRGHFRARAAGVAAQDDRLAIVRHANNLRAVAAAFRTRRGRIRKRRKTGLIVDHIVT